MYTKRILLALSLSMHRTRELHGFLNSSFFVERRVWETAHRLEAENRVGLGCYGGKGNSGGEAEEMPRFKGLCQSLWFWFHFGYQNKTKIDNT